MAKSTRVTPKPEVNDEEILSVNPDLFKDEEDEQVDKDSIVEDEIEEDEVEQIDDLEEKKSVQENANPAKNASLAGNAKAPKKHGGFDEYEVKITYPEKGKPKAEQLKCMRKNVQISQEEADVLNNGVLEGGNTYARMYYPSK